MKSVTKYQARRRRLKMSQREFWHRIGIQQSCGCRYEQGNRVVPKPIRLLFDLAFATPRKALNELVAIRKTTVDDFLREATEDGERLE